MALDPTLSELDFRRSVIKYLVTELQYDESSNPTGYYLFFKPLTNAPKDANDSTLDQWIIVNFAQRRMGSVSSQYISFDLYSREDDEGFEIARMSDAITDIFYDGTATSGFGIKPVTLFNTSGSPWVEAGGILPIYKYASRVMPGKDQTLIKSVTYEFKWGAK